MHIDSKIICLLNRLYVLIKTVGLPSMCHSQSQDPLVDQGKRITRLGSFCLDQDKFRLAPEMRNFPSFIMSDGMDRPN